MHKLCRLLALILILARLASCASTSSSKGGGAYTVRPGDTLSGIAARHGTTVAGLVALNKARYPSLSTNPGLIRVGWQLTLPGEGSATLPATVTGGPSPAGTWTPPTEEQIRQVELEIIRLTNQARREQGLPALVEDPVLAEIARQRARQLASNYSHYGPHGEVLCRELAGLRGYDPSSLGENMAMVIASAPESARRSVVAWMNSPGHRENILRPEFTRIGVGVYNSGPLPRWYGVQIFGR